jgi:hypothetical protein
MGLRDLLSPHNQGELKQWGHRKFPRRWLLTHLWCDPSPERNVVRLFAMKFVILHKSWQRKPEVLEENSDPAILYQQEISHGQAWYRTRAFAVRSRRLTAWAMHGQFESKSNLHYIRRISSCLTENGVLPLKWWIGNNRCLLWVRRNAEINVWLNAEFLVLNVAMHM